MRSVSSAFWAALQGDSPLFCDLMELNTGLTTHRWTTSNLSVVASTYTFEPFPGTPAQGFENGTDLSVGVVNITFANSGLSELVKNYKLDFATLKIWRAFVNSPDLGRLLIFDGKIGDYAYDRNTISAQGRTQWNGLAPNWPYHNYNDDCSWRFGAQGCAAVTTSKTVHSCWVETSSAAYLSVRSGTLSGSYSAGYFDRGRITINYGQNSGEVRTVRVHSGDVLLISHGLPYSVSSGTTLQIYPGCRKRLVADCHSKYNQTSSFLGYPWIPKQERAY